MKSKIKSVLSVILVLAMMITMIPFTASTTKAADNEFYRIVHLDAGRKYFSVDSIKSIIDTAEEAGYNQVELYLSDNQGFRFALDDMTITTSTGNTYDLTKALGDGYSDGSKYPDGSGKYLTQDEMTEIIKYASGKGIDIVPCINVPGHMGAILEEFPDFRYSTSKSSIDLENEEAVAFAQAITEKYASYFAGQGVRYYNLGADEYANDMSTMGFAGLYKNNKYQNFVDFLNSAAEIVINHGMTPRAFNDGIYYNNDISVKINTKIQVCYWSSGWSGYDVASAETIASQGHAMINTHGDYYWVLGNSSWQCSEQKASQFNYKSFQGGTIEEPAGAMFCIWCDVGNADGTDDGSNVVNQTKNVITAFGKTLPGSGIVTPAETTVSCEDGTVSVTAAGLTSVTCSKAQTPLVEGAAEGKVVAYNVVPVNADGNYIGKGTVTISVPEGWDTTKLGAFVVESNGAVSKVDGTYIDGKYTFIAPHFSVMGLYEAASASEVEITDTKEININIGKTITETINGADYSNQINADNLDEKVATIKAEKTEVVGEIYWELVTNGAEGIEDGKEYVIASGNSGSVHALSKTGGCSGAISVSANKIQAVDSDYVFTLEKNGSGWNLKDSDGKFLYPTGKMTSILGFSSWNYEWSLGQNSPQTVTINGDASVTIGRVITSESKSKTAYISYSKGGNWSAPKYSVFSSPSNLYLFKKVTTAAGTNTTVTFTGVSAGTTEVIVGNTKYVITVTDAAPDNALTADSLPVEYWITNSKVYTTSNTSSASSTSINKQNASSEAGVAITECVPETAYSNYDGWLEVRYWQAMRLDSSNHQSSASSDDETPDGTALTHVRYYNNAWQYKTTDGVWHYFESEDQLVAYYMRHTEITKEVTTAMKDWGYETDSTTPDTSSGDGQVALSVAVVYPDNTVSPTENEIYSNSTTIFNYWSGRDIGIIAPMNNSDYEIEKITVTDGARSSNPSDNVWYSNDSISWNKKTVNDDGDEWYDEQEIWNDSMGTNPVVNGKASNITWSAKNTAKLVLIYLKPVHHESNLTVNYVDDSANGTLIRTGEVVVAYEGVEAPVTFLNGLVQKSEVKVGTFTLDDDAYIVNSSNVNQTFNKNIAIMDDVVEQYKSGLYIYVSADISEDGKTLTLHYALDSSKISQNYIVDFGVPVKVPLSEVADGATSANTTVTIAETAFGTAEIEEGYLVYTPERIMTATDVVSLKVSNVSVRIGFVPATTVYYEEGFASYTGVEEQPDVSTTKTQTASKPGEKALYGYDSAYSSDAGDSDGKAVTLSTGGKGEFTFKGTGFEIYSRSEEESGKIMIYLYKDGKITNLYTVDTKQAIGKTADTDMQNQIAYNVPIVSVTDLEAGTYTVKMSVVKTTNADGTKKVKPVYIDGYRIYSDTSYNDIYTQDVEANPKFIDLRNVLLAGLGVKANDGQYAQQAAENIITQVYAESDGAGAVILDQNGTSGITSGDEESEITSGEDLRDNGPKNEIYLKKDQALAFKLNQEYKNVQIGLKALNRATTYQINNGLEQSLSSSTDMFYKVDGKTVTITNKGEGILAITKLKVVGDSQNTNTSAMFAVLSANDLMPALYSLGYESEPTITYADAMVNVSVQDMSGKEIASTILSANGEAGTETVFNGTDILTTVKNVIPEGYALPEGTVIEDVTVLYGESSDVVVKAGKIATLNVTYKTVLGKIVGNSTLTAVQTSTDIEHSFTAKEIRDAVPEGHWTGTLLNTKVKYGSNGNRTVYVLY